MNRKQVEQIVNKYLKKIYGLILTKTANLQDAEDLTQEIALKLYGVLLVSEIDYISAFVWRVTRNTLANYYRGKTRSGLGICIDEIAQDLTTHEDICEGLMQQETIKRLHNEIAYLSKCKERLLLCITMKVKGKRKLQGCLIFQRALLNGICLKQNPR